VSLAEFPKDLYQRRAHSGKAARRQKILEAKRTNRCLLNSTKTQEAI